MISTTWVCGGAAAGLSLPLVRRFCSLLDTAGWCWGTTDTHPYDMAVWSAEVGEASARQGGPPTSTYYNILPEAQAFGGAVVCGRM